MINIMNLSCAFFFLIFEDFELTCFQKYYLGGFLTGFMELEDLMQYDVYFKVEGWSSTKRANPTRIHWVYG